MATDRPVCLPPFERMGTTVVHAGQEPDGITGAVIPALSLATTFRQKEPGVYFGKYDYSRAGNPTREAFEVAIAAAEGGKHGLAFSSGSAAISAIIHLLTVKDHLICVNDVYGGTNRYMNKVAGPIGYESSFVDMTDLNNLRAAFKPNTKLVWVETPTNPTLRVIDIRGVADIVAEHPGVILVVDNTFLSPYFQRPLSLGADIVMHSATKYINGHSDCVLGVLITNNAELFQRLVFLQKSIGAVPSAFDCFLANRGLKTLHVRMEAHQRNAFAVARFLESSPYVVKVTYPGLPSHKQHAIACKQQTGFGGMVSVQLKGDLETAKRFFHHAKLFVLAESLGGIESLAELPSVMTHAGLRPEEREALGIFDTLVRLSCGIEDAEDLVADLAQALEKANNPA